MRERVRERVPTVFPEEQSRSQVKSKTCLEDYSWSMLRGARGTDHHSDVFLLTSARRQMCAVNSKPLVGAHE